MTYGESETQEKRETAVKIYNFLHLHQKSFLIGAFLVAIILPLIIESVIFYILAIPDSSISTILEILESSVNKWEDAFFVVSNDVSSNQDLLGYSLSLVQNGIGRIYDFLEKMIFFYQQIFSFKFTVINNTGYILTGLFLTIPVLMIWICFQLYCALKNQTSNNKSVKSVLFSLITPRNLFIIILFFPFPRDFIWITAILTLLILVFYLLSKSYEWRLSEPRQNFFFAIAWKKALVVLLFIVILLITISGILEVILICIQFTHNFNTRQAYISEELFGTQKIFSETVFSRLTITSFLGISPNTILISIIICAILFTAVWIYMNWSMHKKRITSTRIVIQKIFLDLWNPRSIFGIVISIAIILPIFNAIYLQGATRDITFILLNFPWIIGLIFFDPLQFFGILINATKRSFDIIITSSREIVNDIVPINPSQPSIFGSIQPSLFLATVIFLIISIIFTLGLILLQKQKEGETWKTTLLSHYALLGFLIPITMISALVLFILEPTNFYTIYGSHYEIDTESWGSFISLTTIALFLIVIGFIIGWSYVQIFRKGRSSRITLKVILINTLAICVAIIMIIPFVWMIKNSLQTNTQNIRSAEDQGLIPDPMTIANYAQLFGLIDPSYETLEYRVITWLFNSLVTAVTVTVFLVIFSAMAGYCLAKRDFLGRKALLSITVGIMLVPSYVQVIPLYLELNRLGFVGSLLGVILPFLIQPFSVFLCTEFMRSIPDDYLDAARVDGYSEFQIFWKVVLPLSIPVISVMTIINFIGNWNAFLWPLLLLDQSRYAPNVRTLPLGIYRINAELQEQIGVVLALATIIVIPIFIILFLAQDYIKRGVTVEGLKG
ncbi:MAG: carbohydrate ABC transporter permease [Promethearchaeota archaeon]